jgi:hypothetical protein
MVMKFSRQLYLVLIYFVYKFICLGKKIFVINGMRRSGNHAFVLWLTNALLEQKAEISYKNDTHFYAFGTEIQGRLVHFNEINVMGWMISFRLLIRNFSAIRKAKYVLISLEDVPCDSLIFKFIPSSKLFYIKRNVLNLVASRIRGLIRDAHEGRANRGFEVTPVFLDNILKWNNNQSCQFWHYEKWMENPSYRQSFLYELGLNSDIVPHESSHGGGSSFNTAGSFGERFKEIDWDQKLIRLLSLEKYEPILTRIEVNFLNSKKIKV